MSGSGYRPICDTWMLGRCKYKGSVKRYGGYLAGFLIRARDLLGVHIDDPVLHVCGGLAREYPFAGFGPNDMTMDLDPATNPDFLQDAREAWAPFRANAKICHPENYGQTRGFKAYLIDPPYSEEDAKHYLDGKGDSVYPSPNSCSSAPSRSWKWARRSGSSTTRCQGRRSIAARSLAFS